MSWARFTHACQAKAGGAMRPAFAGQPPRIISHQARINGLATIFFVDGSMITISDAADRGWHVELPPAKQNNFAWALQGAESA